MSDANQTAARIAAQTAKQSESNPPASIEAAWQAWSRGVGKVNTRTMTLLKAAFEAGAEAGRQARLDAEDRRA